MIKIVKMKLQNFKGIKELDVRFDGKNATVSGPNACGKTTLADAYLWVINGISYEGGRRIEDSIKMMDENGNQTVDGGIEHSVEVTLDIDGKLETLKKVFYEEWKRKRGAENKEMSGHRTKCFIDGMAASTSVYDRNIENLGGTALAMAARPQTFTEMETKKRREILMNLIGGERSLAVDSGKSAGYITNYGGVNGALDAVAHEISSTNKLLDEYPVRIDEAVKNVPEAVDTDGFSAKLESLEHEKADLLAKIANAEKGGDTASELREKLLALKEKRSQLERESVMSVKTELEEMYRIRSTQKAKKDQYESEISSLSGRIKTTKSDNERFVSQWLETKKSVYKPIETCPYCGRPLQQELKDKGLEKFNLEKAERLDKISAGGKKSAKELKQLTSKLDLTRSQLKETLGEMNAIIDNISNLEAKLKTAGDSPELKAVNDDIARTQEAIDKAKSGDKELVEKMRSDLAALNEEISCLSAKAAGATLRENALKRVDELKKQQKETAAKYDDLIEIKKELEATVKRLVDETEQKIADVFRYAKFCMYKKQINGGISQCCEVLDNDDVPMTAANTASRVVTNLDIARAIAEHAGVNCPVFVDNAESINDIPDIGMQMIKLKVSDEDGLSIHLEEKEGA